MDSYQIKFNLQGVLPRFVLRKAPNALCLFEKLGKCSIDSEMDHILDFDFKSPNSCVLPFPALMHSRVIGALRSHFA